MGRREWVHTRLGHLLVDGAFRFSIFVAELQLTVSRCAQPYLYDTSRNVVITYDDPHSLGLKGQLAAQQGIGGMAMVRSPPFPASCLACSVC